MKLSLPELDRRSRLGRALERWRWFVPGMGVKRYAFVIAIGLSLLMMGFFQFARVGPWRTFFTSMVIEVGRWIPGQWPTWVTGALVFVVGVALVWLGIVGLNRSILRAVGAEPLETLDAVYARRKLSRGPRIVAIGGGTGLSNLLSGLKRYSSNLTAIVAVTDDGGSSGRLRDALGMPAPGDMTDCFAALSDTPVLAELLTHRFRRGEGIEGHTFGNLLIATLSEDRGDFTEAALAVNEILKVRGQVVPATNMHTVLVAELMNGQSVRGESSVRQRPNSLSIRRMHLEPENPPAPSAALEAIRHAELIVIGPGSLYTSVIPPLLVPEVGAAIRSSRARVVYIANIMTEAGETDHMSASQHCRVLESHLGRKPDVALVNSAPISAVTLERYKAEAADPVMVDREALSAAGIRVQARVLTRDGGGQHNPDLLSVAIVELLSGRGAAFK
jgi:uncharacterized cofD-like protein